MNSRHSNTKIHLPKKVITRDGHAVSTSNEYWALDPITLSAIDFTKIRPFASNELIASLKIALAHFVKTKSSAYTSANFGRVVKMLQTVTAGRKIRRISASTILSYRSTLSSRHENDLGGARAFLRYWYNLGLPCISKDAIQALEKLTLKGAPKGEAVLTLSPTNGPFSELEFKNLNKSLLTSFQEKKITLAEFLIVWIFSSFGIRPIQLVMLRCSDLVYTKDPTAFFIKIPRGKQRHQARRTEFNHRVLATEVGKLFLEHIENNRRDYPKIFDESGDAPLFIDPLNRTSGHYNSTPRLLMLMGEIIGKLGAYSERTQMPLKVTARRLRYTLGTRAASEGASELIIAELLDHCDTQNVKIYSAATNITISRIDKALAVSIGPIIKAFRGELILNPRSAKRANDPSSQIAIQSIKSIPLGNCGCSSDCLSISPKACYTCGSFQPWKNSNHDKMLDILIEERNRAFQLSKDEMYASACDLEIMACGELVNMCSRKSHG